MYLDYKIQKKSQTWRQFLISPSGFMFVHDFEDLLIVFKAPVQHLFAYLLSCQDENFKNSLLGNTNNLFPILFLGNLNQRDIQYHIEYYVFEVLAGWNRRLDRSFHLFSPDKKCPKIFLWWCGPWLFYIILFYQHNREANLQNSFKEESTLSFFSMILCLRPSLNLNKEQRIRASL